MSYRLFIKLRFRANVLKLHYPQRRHPQHVVQLQETNRPQEQEAALRCQRLLIGFAARPIKILNHSETAQQAEGGPQVHLDVVAGARYLWPRAQAPRHDSAALKMLQNASNHAEKQS